MTWPDDCHRRSAFTLVELLVVIAIVGGLAAILLPAVQAARESARRTQCASQLKQLAVAVLSFEASSRALPAAGVVDIRPDDDESVEIVNPFGGLQLSWIVTVLPFAEQASLAAAFDMSKSALAQAANPQERPIALLLCPSDDSSPRIYRHPIMASMEKSFAKGNYAAYTSPFHVDLQLLYRGALIAGGQPLAAIEDGASNTLALAEIRTLQRTDDSRGAWALAWPGATLLAFDMHPEGWDSDSGSDRFAAAVNSPYRASAEGAGKSQPPNCLGPNRDTIARCTADSDLYRESAAAQMPCTMTPPAGLSGHMSAAPRSLHPGGVNGAFLDGRVEFIPDNIDEFVMAYLISIAEGRQ